MSGNNVTFKKINLEQKIIWNKLTQEINSTPLSNWTDPADAHKHDKECFGMSVAIDGDYAIIGAPGVSGADFASKIYVFERENGVWVQKSALWSNGTKLFGTSVAISGDIYVVGAPEWGSTAKGYIWVYRKEAGAWTYKDGSSGIDAQERLGSDLDIDGNYLIIGADQAGAESGKAYIWENPTSGPTGAASVSGFVTGNILLKGSDTANGDRFGYSVAIDGNYAIVGTGNDWQTAKGV